MARLTILATSFLWALLLPSSAAFLTRASVNNRQLEQATGESQDDLVLTKKRLSQSRVMKMAQTSETSESMDSLEVVLFGVGDLRMDDHEGLYRATHAAGGDSKQRSKILPLVILDDACLSSIPGIVSHTIDTASMLVAALEDLHFGLKSQLGLDLQIISPSQQSSLAETLEQVLKKVANGYAASNIHVHVHDLGDADNGMGYSPYSQLQQIDRSNPFEIVPWTANLRSKPWATTDSLPDLYPEFASKFATDAPALPIAIPKTSGIESALIVNSNMPTAEEITERLMSTLNLDPVVMKAEINTGMFQSHWGGLNSKSVGETKVLDNLKVFVEVCQEDDALWAQHPQNVAKGCPRNEQSLEHATVEWFLKGDSNEPGVSNTNNLLAGEGMTRYLAAPLLLGTVSPRRIWYMATRPHNFFQSPLKTLVEGREWHKLLAAKNIRTRSEYQTSQPANNGETKYGYWRWHGFLCRYAQTPLSSDNSSSLNLTRSKDGVLFFHGFGASGAQWNKAYQELSTIVSDDHPLDDSVLEGLAPDLLGFGESEKPPISYSIYVWDAQCTDFIKEVAVAKQNWGSYIVGGNSIGGFSAASTAANECVPADGKELCSSGAPGTGKCRGVVLMNPAGPIKSREDVARESGLQLTVAQISGTGALPAWYVVSLCSLLHSIFSSFFAHFLCLLLLSNASKPPPRPVGRIFGNGLLSYLRPRIQSICVNLYPTNPAAVDDALCDAIDRDSNDPGAINVMISGAKLPPPRTMNEMLNADFGNASEEAIQKTMPEASFGGPVLVATGVLDPLNDAKGRSEGLAALRDGIEFDPINAGHCPHDELPKDVATSIAKWMRTTIRPNNAATGKATKAASLV